MTNIYIPERFKRIIQIHIVKNLLKNISVRVPLILGIQGASGEGKTFLCEMCLKDMNVKPFLISGGQLESGVAGEPAKLVRDTYIAAGRSIKNKECKTSVVLINDVDTGLGNWGEKVQTTINTQTVYGELMHLVDYPNQVEGVETKRIPIILTGNDFTKLYRPLVRAGRMASFVWKPSLEEKVQIVIRMFPEISEQNAQLLVERFSDQPVAFFSYLRSTLMDDALWKVIKNISINTTIERIINNYEPDFKNINVFDLNNLIQTGIQLKSLSTLKNHLS